VNRPLCALKKAQDGYAGGVNEKPSDFDCCYCGGLRAKLARSPLGPTAMNNYLTEQLRESVSYLKSQGWTNTAELVSAAATELELLALKVEKLERRIGEGEPRNEEIRRRA
jgi:hypothetical protein